MSKVKWGMFLISLAGLVAALIGAGLAGATLVVPAVAHASVDEDDEVA